MNYKELNKEFPVIKWTSDDTCEKGELYYGCYTIPFRIRNGLIVIPDRRYFSIYSPQFKSPVVLKKFLKRVLTYHNNKEMGDIFISVSTDNGGSFYISSIEG